MIVTKTPLRISFLGGGSDLPEYFQKEGNRGAVLSTTIDKNIYIALNRCVNPHIRAVYSEVEQVEDAYELKHDRIREVLKMFGLRTHVEICSFSDVPTKGTGLGSSSTFTVGLIAAVMESIDGEITSNVLAQMAYFVERHLCGEPVGCQDQYAAALGGLNLMKFSSSGVEVQRMIKVRRSTMIDLQENLICFNTGVSRQSSTILLEQAINTNLGTNDRLLGEMVDLVDVGVDLLEEDKIDDFGDLLGEAWKIKKKLCCGITLHHIDEMYAMAIKAGAIGGKLLGAGAGGYLLVYAREADRRKVIDALSAFEVMDFKFTDAGSAVEMSDGPVINRTS